MWIHDLHDAARSQHGIISSHQALAIAPTRAAARNELRSAHWELIDARMFRLRGSSPSPEQAAMSALLSVGPGAVISHHSAGFFWGLPGPVPASVHVTTLRNGAVKDIDGVVAHRARRLASDQVTALRGLSITRPERVPFDLANIGVRAERVERIVDRLWSDRLVSGRSLRRVLQSLPKRGFRGTALMRALLDDRGDDWVPPASGLESRVMRLLDSAGVGGFERQVELGGNEWIGRVDFVDRRRRIVIEVQSDRHHAALSSRRDDAARFERLEAAGFTVVTVWEDEVWHRPADFIGRVHNTPS